MPDEKKYQVHQKPMTYRETKNFIQEYRHAIRRPFDRYTRMLPHVPSYSYVLDYGCGWGVFSEMVHCERECRVDGIDLDPNSIEIARDFIGERDGLSFSVKRVREIADETYDVVISTQVIEHTLNPGNYLRECNRILRMGGHLIISAPNIVTPRYLFSLLRLQGQRFRTICETTSQARDRTSDHVQAWDPPTFCRLLCAVGFEYEGHEFMEGLALPKNLYWRNPWGPLKHWAYTMMFKVRKVEFLDIAAHE